MRDRAVLQRFWESAKAAWPDLELTRDDFLRHLEDRVADDPEAGLPHAGDLYLACACAGGDRRAIAELDARFMRAVGGYIAKIDSSSSFADEVRQALWRKLLVPEEGARAKILDYTGHGPLGGWLRVAAIRTARNLKRGAKPSVPIQDLGEQGGVQLRSASPDPELSYFKDHYAREFRTAFETTLGSLSDRERNILRLYFLEGMSSSAIAAVYGVSGATVRLWIKQWREAILAETRRRLGAQLRVDTATLDSVLGLIESRFDLSISRLLKNS